MKIMDIMNRILTMAVISVLCITGCFIWVSMDVSDELEETEDVLEHQYGKEISEIKDFGCSHERNGFNAWGTAVTEYGDYMFTYNSATGTTTWVST
jgi:hypothetical protein